jgi:hypothetical protein
MQTSLALWRLQQEPRQLLQFAASGGATAFSEAFSEALGPFPIPTACGPHRPMPPPATFASMTSTPILAHPPRRRQDSLRPAAHVAKSDASSASGGGRKLDGEAAGGEEGVASIRSGEASPTAPRPLSMMMSGGNIQGPSLGSNPASVGPFLEDSSAEGTKGRIRRGARALHLRRESSGRRRLLLPSATTEAGALPRRRAQSSGERTSSSSFPGHHLLPGLLLQGVRGQLL